MSPDERDEMKEMRIDIICPQCLRKGLFVSPSVQRGLKLVPDVDGQISCGHCGLNRSSRFDPSMYWYKVQVEDRFLFARTIEDVMHLKNFFSSDTGSHESPEEDLPAVFYRNRRYIANRLNEMIKSHI